VCPTSTLVAMRGLTLLSHPLSFVAVHESAFGTKRTYRDDPLLVRFRGEADMHDRVV
jgi:hypothetical protein